MAITRITGNTFEAGGRNFRITKLDTLSGYRYMKVIEFTFLVKYGMSLDVLQEEYNKALNWARNPYGKDNWANLLKWLENQTRALQVDDFNEITRVMNVLKLCSVFIIEDDEDESEWDESKSISKIDLWLKHVAVADFFLLLPVVVKNLNENWEELQENLGTALKSQT